MNTEQKLAQAYEVADFLDSEDLSYSAEIVRGLIRLVRELEARSISRGESSPPTGEQA